MAVALVHSISPAEVIADDRSATGQSFARSVGDRWGVGNAACNDGIVFFLSAKDRTFAIVTGKGARRSLSDNTAARILTRIKPLLRSQKYDEAVVGALLSIREVLQTGALSGSDDDDSGGGGLAVILLVGLFLCGPAVCGIFGLLAVAVLKVGAYLLDGLEWLKAKCIGATSGGGQTHPQQNEQAVLTRIEHELDRPDDDQQMCAICLDDFDSSDGSESKPLAPSAVTTLPCGHKFHASCCDEWLSRAAIARCPM